MRKSSGLRNKFRPKGGGTYRTRRAENGADRYGSYENGRCTQLGTVAGRQFDPLTEARKYKDQQGTHIPAYAGDY